MRGSSNNAEGEKKLIFSLMGFEVENVILDIVGILVFVDKFYFKCCFF